MRLSGNKLTEVSFPVGGIGAGCIGISGTARLDDWEIFNCAGKNRRNGCSHFAIRAEKDGAVIGARMLNSDLEHGLIGNFEGKEAMFSGFGWGPASDTMAGFPHFRKCTLNGEFPVAEFAFEEASFPAEASLAAWSPFVPGRSDISSLPAAIFELGVKNTSAETLAFTGICVLENPWRNPEALNRFEKEGRISRIVLANNLDGQDFDAGELCVSTDELDVSYQEYFYFQGWKDYLEVYGRDLLTPGHFANRKAPASASARRIALLASHVSLASGESGTMRFVLSWYIPCRKNTWDAEATLAKLMAESGIKENRWRNYYAKLCASAADAASRILAEYGDLRRQVFTFRDALHSSTLPKACLEGAAENLSVLVSPTCLRCEDGTFWGWEGVGVQKGSCSGSCQHVWNYAQALSLLFPDLERSMRQAHFKYGMDTAGGLHFWLMLPLGIKAKPDWFRPCVDGAFGEVMKTYREWKISGDDEWMKSLWPKVKKTVEFAWSPENQDKWDPGRTGILTGRQHHTLDMELFGPSGWLNGHYLVSAD